MRTDLEIARAAELRPINDIADDMGIPLEYVEQRGHGLAKIGLGALKHMGDPRAKYVLVTAVNPTPSNGASTVPNRISGRHQAPIASDRRGALGATRHSRERESNPSLERVKLFGVDPF